MKLYDDFISFKLLTAPHIKNWHSLFLFRLGIINEVKFVTRQGIAYRLDYSGDQLCFFMPDNALTFFVPDKKQFNQTLHLILDNFIGGQYSKLPIKGQHVIDIGACIADTAILFALQGAKHVYAYEPYPYTYRIAKNNILNNNLEDRITLSNTAVLGKRGNIKVSNRFEAYGHTELKDIKKGKQIRVTTLKDILKQNCLKNPTLKLDAEGAEYKIILDSSYETLRKFKYIMLEYHDGPLGLWNKLSFAGFQVTLFPSSDIYYKKTPNKQGLLLAMRTNQKKLYKYTRSNNIIKR